MEDLGIRHLRPCRAAPPLCGRGGGLAEDHLRILLLLPCLPLQVVDEFDRLGHALIMKFEHGCRGALGNHPVEFLQCPGRLLISPPAHEIMGKGRWPSIMLTVFRPLPAFFEHFSGPGKMGIIWASRVAQYVLGTKYPSDFLIF